MTTTASEPRGLTERLLVEILAELRQINTNLEALRDEVMRGPIA